MPSAEVLGASSVHGPEVLVFGFGPLAAREGHVHHRGREHFVQPQVGLGVLLTRLGQGSHLVARPV